MARTGRVYLIRDPDGNMVYIGSTEDPYRLTRHRNQCKSDGLACPLYRHANEHHDGMSGYTEETVATINLPGGPRDREDNAPEPRIAGTPRHSPSTPRHHFTE